MMHVLKCEWPWFDHVLSGRKKFEVRINDRNFQVGDTLRLKEYDPKSQSYSGKQVDREVTYMIDGPPFLPIGLCVMGIEPTESA